MDLGIPGIADAVQVGAGGAGVVYRARQPEFDRDVAVKVFPAEEDPRRVERERLAIGPLSDHPNIVPVYGAGVTGDGRPYLLMAYMPGGSLADLVRRDGALTPERTAELGADIARAVAEAHGRGIRHRDIKPQNILLDRFGNPRLADFGIAHLGADAFRTSTDIVSGTVSYLAPEVILGQEGTESADVYSLGATLYFAVEGRHLVAPRTDETYEALVYRRVTAAAEVTFTERTPPWLQVLLRQAVAAAPQDRFASAAAFADALGAVPSSVPAAEPPTGPGDRRAPSAGPSPWIERGTGGRDPEQPPVWTARPAPPGLEAIPPLPPMPGLPVRPVPPGRRLRRSLAAAAVVLALAGGFGALAVNTRPPQPRRPDASLLQLPYTGKPENRSTVMHYRSALKADPAEVLRNVEAFRQASGQPDPKIGYAELIFWDTDLPAGGKGWFEVAKPGADRASETYRLVDGTATHRAGTSDPDGYYHPAFPLSSVPWAKVPELMAAARKICHETPGPYDVTSVSVLLDTDTGTTRLSVSLVDLVEGSAGHVTFKTDGTRYQPSADCWFS